jgi:hypothetical protein
VSDATSETHETVAERVVRLLRKEVERDRILYERLIRHARGTEDALDRWIKYSEEDTKVP